MKRPGGGPDQGRAPGKRRSAWRGLDKDLDRMSLLEAGAMHQSRPLLGLGLALAFIVCAMVLAIGLGGVGPGSVAVVAAAALGAYMALNIGANDVANNMGPAVGAGALPMVGAIAIAALFESAGALLAGHEVIETVARGILRPGVMTSLPDFALAMIAALLGSALWVNLATWIRAPVSTTQSVVGGMLGAGLASAGIGAVQWSTLGAIAAGWVLSPLLGAMAAAALVAFLRWRVLYVPDKIAAARRWVPALLGLMVAAFTAYLLQQAPPRFLPPPMRPLPVLPALLAGLLAWGLAIPAVRRQSEGLENRRSALKPLFRLPLICAAALLSFAHGANDVANAVAPLAALVEARGDGTLDAVVQLPFWVTLIGALGISVGLVLFGPRLIRLVGQEITRLNPPRAFCIALAAAVTVLAASALGLPVSSTHVTIGGVFGVGFLREWISRRDMAREAREAGARGPAGPAFPLEERRRRRLVRRSHFLTIIAAWVVTLPAAALIAALALWVMRLLSGLG